MDQSFADLFGIFFALGLLVVAFFVGEWIERRHYKSIRRREARWARLPTVTLKRLPVPQGWDHDRTGLVTGHIVISVDHFKRFVAGLRALFGGRVRTYETLLDRARREAILRMKAKAIEEGYQAVVNVRLETSTLAKAKRKGNRTAGVEVLAFGTGLRLRKTAA